MIKRVTIEDIREISQRSRHVLYGEDPTPVPFVTLDSAQNNGLVAQPEDQTASLESAPPEPGQGFARHTSASKSFRNAYRMIKTQSEHDIPFLFRQEAAPLSQIKGGATLLEAEKEALRHNLIIKHVLARAKTNICFWEIVDQGYDLLERTKPKWRSKGEFKHKFSVHRIGHTYRRHGYHTEIEHRRPNGKLVDLRLSKGDSIFYIEVCASWPIQKELVNIEKDLEGEPLPDEIILAATDRKMREPLELALREMSACTELLRPVRVALAGDLIEFLEIEG
ncbi:MAG: hypothetical protein GY847_23595 [Proteobacteria bacterium]|nr:hypothetical protein [Pseudomonadota bacterium]